MSADIPADTKQTISNLEFEASRLIAIGNYVEAENRYEKILSLIRERQIGEERRIHQGAPLHMKGISLLLQNKYPDALVNFLLAYITDTVNVPVGQEDQADQTPAKKILESFFGIINETFDLIKDLSRNMNQDRSKPFNPQRIFNNLLIEKNISEKDILKLSTRIPNQREISSLKNQFFQIINTESTAMKGKTNANKVDSILNRLIVGLSEIRTYLPNILSKPVVNILSILSEQYFLLAFIDEKEWGRITQLISEGKHPFPGLIKPVNLDAPVAFSLEGKNTLFRGNIVDYMYSFSLGKDSTSIIVNHKQRVKIESIGENEYFIELAYLVSFGDQIDYNNLYDYLDDLIAFSIKTWRS